VGCAAICRSLAGSNLNENYAAAESYTSPQFPHSYSPYNPATSTRLRETSGASCGKSNIRKRLSETAQIFASHRNRSLRSAVRQVAQKARKV
jgi:hypothetical protein